jgi:hypothetical protein
MNQAQSYHVRRLIVTSFTYFGGHDDRWLAQRRAAATFIQVRCARDRRPALASQSR